MRIGIPEMTELFVYILVHIYFQFIHIYFIKYIWLIAYWLFYTFILIFLYEILKKIFRKAKFSFDFIFFCHQFGIRSFLITHNHPLGFLKNMFLLRKHCQTKIKKHDFFSPFFSYNKETFLIKYKKHLRNISGWNRWFL